jgi:hypothetical protein
MPYNLCTWHEVMKWIKEQTAAKQSVINLAVSKQIKCRLSLTSERHYLSHNTPTLALNSLYWRLYANDMIFLLIKNCVKLRHPYQSKILKYQAFLTARTVALLTGEQQFYLSLLNHFSGREESNCFNTALWRWLNYYHLNVARSNLPRL